MITAVGDSRAARGAATVLRLLDAAASILTTEGAAGVSVQRIADAAGTSKGLVHYHFPDKDALLVACAERLTAQLIDADRTALAQSTPGSVLDDLWAAFAASVHNGTRRALIALATDGTAALRRPLKESAARRRAAATETLVRIERLLDFAPRIPRATLAVALVALADGLALEAFARGAALNRSAFDAFWLTVLTMDAE